MTISLMFTVFSNLKIYGVGVSDCWVLWGSSVNSPLAFPVRFTAAPPLSLPLDLVFPLAFCLVFWLLPTLLISYCSLVSVCLVRFHLSLLLPLLTSEGVLGCQGTCMSDQVVERLTFAVEQLTIATDQLRETICAERRATVRSILEEPTPAVESLQSDITRDGFQIVIEELSRLPFPDRFQEERIRQEFRGAEEGPPEAPSFLVPWLRTKITNRPPGVEARAEIAYRTGYWSKIAIDCQIPYTPRQLHQYCSPRHWVVLRSSYGEPFRTINKTDLKGSVLSVTPCWFANHLRALRKLRFIAWALAPLSQSFEDAKITIEVCCSWRG